MFLLLLAYTFCLKQESSFCQTWQNVSNCEHCGAFYPVVDTSNNLYVTGTYNSTLTLGADTYTTRGSSDGIVIKYDSIGNYLWAKTFGGFNQSPKGDGGDRVGIDNQGNLIIGGRINKLSGDYDYDGTPINNLIQGDNVFTAKIASNNGSLIWQNAFYIDQGYVWQVVTDDLSNVYVSVLFSGILKINGESIYTTYNTPLIVKYDMNGNFKWFKTLLCPNGTQISTLKYNGGGLYLGGGFNGTLTCDSQSINSNPSTSNNGYIAKIDTGGSFVKLKRLITSTTSSSVNILEVSKNNNIVAFCKAIGTSQIDTFNLSTSYGHGIAIKMDTSLTVKNVAIIGNMNYSILPQAIISNDSSFYLTAEYTSGGTVGDITLTGNGFFVTKIDDSLNIVWTKVAQINNPTNTNTRAVAYLNFNNAKNSLIVSGRYQQSLTLDGYSLTGGSEFYAHISNLSTSNNSSRFLNPTKNNIALYPNPSQSGVFNIALPKDANSINGSAKIYNTQGQLISDVLINLASGKHSIDISSLGKGTYIIKIKADKSLYSGQIVYE